MSKETKDKNSSGINTDRIMTQEEYEKAMLQLKEHIVEYRWIQRTDKASAIKEIDAELQKIRGMLNGEKNNEQRYYSNYKHLLEMKQEQIKDDQYAVILRGKINTLVARIIQFKIDSKEYSLEDVIKSFIGKDEETKKARKMDKMISRARIDGLQKYTDVQPIEKIMASMQKYCNFVGITLPEPENQTTDIAISDGYLTKSQQDYFDFVNQFILSLDEKAVSEPEATEHIEPEKDVQKIRVVAHENIRNKTKVTQNRENNEGEISQ